MEGELRLDPVNMSPSSKFIDKELFKKCFDLVAARVVPQKVGILNRICRKDLLELPRVKHVYQDQDHKLVLLNQKATLDGTKGLSETTKSFINENNIKLVPFKLNVDYDYWRAEDILDAILPPGQKEEHPSGFTAVGHIAHMNLREEWLPYKHLIGQVILDKNPSIKTVVNKTDSIDTKFRTFQMEVLAGDPDFMVVQSESNCKFRFDFSKVYWNSRLSTEHDRLVSQFQEGEAVCDVMAGVGPFACPAGKKRVIVFANDLNPSSYESLVDNVQINKVGDFVKAYNRDGREFIRSATEELLEFSKQGTIALPPPKKLAKGNLKDNTSSSSKRDIHIPPVFSHYVMNLPGSALEFLDAFNGCYEGKEHLFENRSLPKVHVHCFSRYDPPMEDIINRIEASMRYRLRPEELSLHYVRKVAPKKDMYCCTFTLPRSVIFGKI
ncbi:tRNA methyltransferase Trm5 [Schizosaccharomyces octosporus yFS286]|uniref:tRNA (guanine(37)-N1)-methyltransferase n=1 Tax=Schizosaccharomyces octosporus (strain yFS286) TaxID=483514 RepID=S9R693_SCHOY|nr:tRNA methyltransferase Trm5 [Schizosaccharomyces octosporus yFS286]EPX73835.1 tRNA methyltransferase Trm5 [Schizosaccharomyces octosporus yFS286]